MMSTRWTVIPKDVPYPNFVFNDKNGMAIRIEDVVTYTRRVRGRYDSKNRKYLPSTKEKVNATVMGLSVEVVKNHKKQIQFLKYITVKGPGNHFYRIYKFYNTVENLTAKKSFDNNVRSVVADVVSAFGIDINDVSTTNNDAFMVGL